MIERAIALAAIRQALRRSRIVALVGTRQCGKTTLASELVDRASLNYFDLENPRSLARLAEPMTELERLRGIVVIDEVHHRPDLFPVLRVLADRRPLPARFLILGSASPGLLRQTSESLAGRIETVTLGGFSIGEIGAASLHRHWLRGGFPSSFLARSLNDSNVWREQFVRTFLQRDVPQLGFNIPPPALQRFWSMIAHYHANVWNAAEPARSLGISEQTVRRYLDLLTDLFMIRQLAPWHENLRKRQVKAPKIYVRDSGLLHHLLGIRSDRDLLIHPKVGASWEGYAVEEILKTVQPDEVYYWRTQQGAELDLLLFRRGRRFGIEIKRADAPTITPSMRIALADLRLDHLTVIYPGPDAFELTERISVVPLAALAVRNVDLLLPRRARRRRKSASL